MKEEYVRRRRIQYQNRRAAEMPLFGKKEARKESVPRVDEKYDLRDVLGT